MENALRLYEIEELEEMEQQQKEAFIVKDNGGASWCLRKIRALKAQIEDNKRVAEGEILRIQDWLAQTNEPLEKRIQSFEAMLEAYHREIYEQDPKQKTIKLPHGILKLRAQQPDFQRDDEKLLSWLKQNGMNDFIKVIERPEWGELKKKTLVAGDKVVYKDTGEVIDGVTAEDRPPKFSVEV